MRNIQKALIRKTTYETLKEELFPDGKAPILYPAGRLELIQAGLYGRKYDEDDYGYIEIEREQVPFNEHHMWAINEDKTMAVMVERCNCDGITKQDIMEIFREMDHLGFSDEEEFVPVTVEANNSYAFGLMAMAAAEEALSFYVGQDSDFAKEAIAVMEDMDLETEDHHYTFNGVRTHLYR